MKIDATEIARALSAIIAPGQVFEIRALEATTPNNRRPRTVFGYFSDPVKASAALKAVVSAKGIYFTPNPVTPALLARAQNRLKDAGKSETTGDKDIAGRRWLPIDCDAIRPAGISASGAEHRAALDCARNIAADLAERGWPEGIFADSGNGGHLLYRVDLAADDGGLIERCLDALAALHGSAAVAVDRGVHNPARIWKLYGTVAAKGDSTIARPHRMARILEMPAAIAPVTLAQLEELAVQAPVKDPPKAAKALNGHAPTGDSFAWLDGFLARNAGNLPLMTGPEPYEGGRRWQFEFCPWNPSEHRNRCAFLIQGADGRIGAGCLHNSCKAAGHNWQALRAMIESKIHPAASDRAEPSAAAMATSTPESPGPAPVLTCLADVDPRAVDWLWPGRIPLGRITLLVGRPGEGKSFLTIYIAATVTRGGVFPDGAVSPSGSVILVSAEDDAGDTIRPRADSAGADVGRVHLLSGVSWRSEAGKTREVMFTLANLAELETAIKAHPDLRLIIIDPIGSYLGGRADAHRDNEVRGILAPVAKLAEKHNVAVLIVAHRRKSGGEKADDVTMGSGGFVGLARVVWHLSRDPNDKTRRLLLSGKNNLAREGDGLAFTIEGNPPCLIWESGPVHLSADEGLAAENNSCEDRPGPKPASRNAAVDWLRGLLVSGGEMATADIQADAKAAGLAWRTVQRAADTLEVVRFKAAFGGGWRWRLPDAREDAKCVPSGTKDKQSGILASSAKQREKHTLNPDGDKLFLLGGNVSPSHDAGMRTPNAAAGAVQP